MRLHFLERRRVDGAIVDAELAVPALGLREAAVPLARGAEYLQPAARMQVPGRPGFQSQRLVLTDAMLDELGIAPRDFGMPRRTRVLPVLPQEGRELRQSG